MGIDRVAGYLFENLQCVYGKLSLWVSSVLALTILLVCSGVAPALATDLVRVGSYTIYLPAPAGMADIQNLSTAFDDAIEKATPSTNIAVAYYLPIDLAKELPADFSLLNLPESDEWAIVHVYRQSSRTKMSDEMFALSMSWTRDNIHQQFEEVKSGIGDDVSSAVADDLSRYGIEEDDLSVGISIGDTIPIKYIKEDSDYLSFANITTVATKMNAGKESFEESRRVVSFGSIVNANGVVIYLYNYRIFRNSDDIEKAISAGETWVAQVRAAN